LSVAEAGIVRVTGAPYSIWIGHGALRDLPELLPLNSFSRVLVIVDEAVEAGAATKLFEKFPSAVAKVPIRFSEREKDLAHVGQLWTKFAEHKLDRSSLVIAVGGGALCDLVGFSAATYMRGCAFVLVPSTLLSQVDAGIGGKTGFNFAGIKNLIGTITQPAAVLIDPRLLESLPRREFVSGAAEMFKHGLIADRAYFDMLSQLKPDLADKKFAQLVRRSLEIKLAIVTRDPNEKGLRKILNFGHTFGHALEATALESGISMTHGEAIAIGMVGELYLSLKLGMTSEQDQLFVENSLASWELPVHAPEKLSRARMQEKMLLDKKNVGGELRLTLLSKIGEAKFDCAVPQAALQESLDYVFFANQNK
jgi:3-dehydroquinate synthase